MSSFPALPNRPYPAPSAAVQTAMQGNQTILQLARVLWSRRAASGFDANLLAESMAYQLVWPD